MAPSISSIHPELQAAAKKVGGFTLNQKTFRFIRLFTKVFSLPKRSDGVRIRNLRIPGPDGSSSLRLRLYRPALSNDSLPVLLWLHGGGYVIGTAEMDDARCIQYAREAGISVLSVNYRCAPEHPFPAALEDSYIALKYAAAHAADLNLDADRIAIGGTSAGGGLAAALGWVARDRGEIQPVFQLLVYPMLDDRTSADVDKDRDYLVWSHENNRFGWSSYLGSHFGTSGLPDYAAPARSENLSGLPPAWIGAGTEDIFYNEDAEYARRLQACGVACEFFSVPGAFHGFDSLASGTEIVGKFREVQMAALKKYLFQAASR